MTGKPLRFLAATLGCWTAVRVALLWPTIESLPALIHAIAPVAAAEPIAFYAEAPASVATPRPVQRKRPAPMRVATTPTPAPLAPGRPSPAAESPPPPPSEASPLRLPALSRGPGRLAASAWIVGRGGGTAEARPGAQLGGAQAGMRLTYALGSARRVALSARVSSPLANGSPEVALGIDWQPSRLPVHILVEQRIATGGARGGPALLLVGGIDPRPLAAGFAVEGYAQAGAVARDGIDGFADGALRVSRPLATIAGRRVAIGVGAWGGVQRGAGRLDIGPQLALPVAGRARLTLDWRQRIAGNARPGSGAVLTLGADF